MSLSMRVLRPLVLVSSAGLGATGFAAVASVAPMLSERAQEMAQETAPEIVAPRSSTEAELLFRRANDAFLDGAYGDAVRLYQVLVKVGYGTADVHSNLGTAAMKASELGVAVLAFERALRLDPGHEDARANLRAALARNIDKVVGAEAGPPLFERIARRLPVRLCAWGFAAFWIALFSGLSLRSLGRLRRVALLLLLVGGIGTLTLGGAVADLLWYREFLQRAVITAPAVSIRKGPSPRFETAFEVHQGLVVRTLDQDGPFVRVRLENGLEGWVRRTDVESIASSGLD